MPRHVFCVLATHLKGRALPCQPACCESAHSPQSSPVGVVFVLIPHQPQSPALFLEHHSCLGGKTGPLKCHCFVVYQITKYTVKIFQLVSAGSCESYCYSPAPLWVAHEAGTDPGNYRSCLCILFRLCVEQTLLPTGQPL